MKTNLMVATDAALRAGGAILEIYKRDFEIEFKADAGNAMYTSKGRGNSRSTSGHST